MKESADESGLVAVDANRPRLDSSVVKALAVLEILSKADVPVGVSAVARQLDLDKSNVHRLFVTLVELGYVQKEADTGRYFPTLKLWECGSAIVARHPLKRAAQPFLRLLQRQTSETAFLSVLRGVEVMYLDRIDAAYPLVAPMQVGSRAPAWRTASGKALLAFQPEPEKILDRIIATEPAAAALDRAALLEDFALIRRRGYSISVNAWIPGISAVAVPILDLRNVPNAAVGIGGVSERFGPEHLESVVRSVQTVAVGIAEALGVQPA